MEHKGGCVFIFTSLLFLLIIFRRNGRIVKTLFNQPSALREDTLPPLPPRAMPVFLASSFTVIHSRHVGGLGFRVRFL